VLVLPNDSTSQHDCQHDHYRASISGFTPKHVNQCRGQNTRAGWLDIF
jgi:hypothetical protein